VLRGKQKKRELARWSQTGWARPNESAEADAASSGTGPAWPAVGAGGVAVGGGAGRGFGWAGGWSPRPFGLKIHYHQPPPRWHQDSFDRGTGRDSLLGKKAFDQHGWRDGPIIFGELSAHAGRVSTCWSPRPDEKLS